MKIQLPWENLVSGSNAFVKLYKTKRFNTALSKKLAFLKMEDITLMSDEFDGELVLFYPWTWVILESSGKLEFLGVYHSDESDDNDAENLPTICIRKANWNKKREREVLQSLGDNTTLGEYFFGESHVKSEIFFVRNDREFVRSVNKISDELMAGLHFDSAKQESDLSYLKLYVYNERIEYKISYSPLVKTEKKIEIWVNNWLDLLNSINKSETLPSDNKFRISYQKSLLDYVKELISDDLVEGDRL